jgi:two-component system sensor histidine kinase/response regulator
LPLSAPVLDTSQLIAAFGEIDDEVREMMRMFVETTAPMIQDLEAAVTARRRPEAEDLAHSAKGAARSAGAMRLAEACAAIEDATERGDWAEADRRLAALAPELAAVGQAVETL